VLVVTLLVGAAISIPQVLGFAMQGSNRGWKLTRIGNYVGICLPTLEVVLEASYIYLFWRFIQPSPWKNVKARNMLVLFIGISTFVLSVDTLMFVMLYTEHFLPSTIISVLGFAIKMKLEFHILNRLVDFSKQRADQQHERLHISFVHKDIEAANQPWTYEQSSGPRMEDAKASTKTWHGAARLASLTDPTLTGTTHAITASTTRPSVVLSASDEALDQIDRQYMGRSGSRL
jgi:hypothetical protein